MTLAEFLTARFDEDEARVRGDYPFVTWLVDDEREDYWNAPEPSGKGWHTSDCGHANGEMGDPCDCGVPARLLLDIESKRKILAMLDTSGEDYYLGGLSLGIMDALAEPYRDHPDYGEV